MAVDDHGLEVLKKAGEQLIPGDKSNYYIKTSEINPFGVPNGADAFSRECIGNNVVYKFRSGGIAGTILKTVTLYYTTPQDPSFLGGTL
jgi:hypothetical protein